MSVLFEHAKVIMAVPRELRTSLIIAIRLGGFSRENAVNIGVGRKATFDGLCLTHRKNTDLPSAPRTASGRARQRATAAITRRCSETYRHGSDSRARASCENKVDHQCYGAPEGGKGFAVRSTQAGPGPRHAWSGAAQFGVLGAVT